MKESKESLSVRTLIPILIGTLCLTASIALLVYRGVRKHVYYESWRDYDECGIS